MNKPFWIACAVLAVAAVGFWAAVVFSSMGGEIAALRAEIETTNGSLRSYVVGKGDKGIFPRSFIDMAREDDRKVEEAKKQLLEQMKNRNLDAGSYPWDWSGDEPARGEAPPVDDTAAFRRWLETRYAWRDAKMRAGDVELASQGERGDWTEWTFSQKDIPVMLANFAVSLEIHDALRRARAHVRVHGRDDRTVERGAKGLMGLTRLAQEPRGARPYGEQSFSVTFTAQLNVVVEAMRLLEVSPRALMVVRSVEIERARDEATLSPSGEEPPVVARVRMGLIEF